MSASQDDLRLMFKEAERRGDRATAVAVMSKLESFEQQQEQPEQQPPSGEGSEFGQQVEEKLATRMEEVNKTLEDYATGKVGSIQAGIQIVGKGGAGSALDVIGEEVIESVKGISLIIPDSIEDPVKDAAKSGWKWLTETNAGEFVADALKGGMKTYNEFKELNPQEAKTLESVVNVGLLLAPTKVKKNADPNILGKAATTINKSAEKTITTRRADFVGGLITPKKTAKVLTDEVARTTEKGVGAFKRNIVALSPREADIAKEIRKIKGVIPKNSVQRNYNIINAENAKLAKQLEKDLTKRRFLVLGGTAEKNIDDAVSKLVSENPVIVGDAQRVASRVATKAKEIISKNSPTPSGLLQSRKELDFWIKSQKGQKAFDPAMENALSVSVRSVRNSINDTLEKSIPSVAVKKSLKKQNLLYEALDNVAPKAAAEANTAIARAWQNAVKVLPFRGVANQELALLFGVGGLGAAAMFAPYVSGALGLSLVAMAGKSAVMSPNTRKGLSLLLKSVDRAVLTSKNPSMIKQLRADRALIIETLKNSETEEE